MFTNQSQIHRKNFSTGFSNGSEFRSFNGEIKYFSGEFVNK